jgi:energy-coupling factor transporter ATP-binding protein EcfA2
VERIKRPKEIPTVFISSTTEDLKPYRQAARDAAVSARFHPEMMEYFLASGQHPPLAACMAKVAEADVVVVIVAYRYGWVPDAADPKSITWLECLEAQRLGKEVLAFLVDKDCEWRVELKESYRVTEALETSTFTPQLAEEAQRNIARLAEFKQWLNGLGLRATFANPDDLRGKVEAALRDRRDRHHDFMSAPGFNPTGYLEYLRGWTAWIDIRGLQVGAGKAYRFPIEDLYIPLTILGAASDKDRVAARNSMALEDALTRRRLVIVGDPGAGKTTFLRHIAYLWTSALLDAHADGLLFPIFIRISELVEHILHFRKKAHRPAAQDSPAWLIDFLNARNDELNWGLHTDFFREKLSSGNVVLLLDGLDESPGKIERDSVARLLENATHAYRECRFVVTTRPLTFTGLAGFVSVQIEPLDPPAIETFLDHWCHALFPESPSSADQHLGELREAMRARQEIRRMARNPVMLAALAVVHWNERRLPERRADLYESILIWLVRAREDRPGRASAERCLTFLQQLALAMQSEGRHSIAKDEASAILTSRFADTLDPSRALWFLEEAAIESGILTSDGDNLRFWHQTFQEYLAARAVADRSEPLTVLFEQGRLYRSDWREVVLLFVAILFKQSRERVDATLHQMLEFAARGSTTNRAMSLILLSAILRDLQPSAYRLPLESQSAVSEIVKTLSEAIPDGSDLRLKLELMDAVARLGFKDAQAVRSLMIPVSTLFEQALNNVDSQIRELSVSALLAWHFEDAGVRSGLVRIANAEGSWPFRGYIERAFENRFSPWKRWLAGLDDDGVVPDAFNATTTSFRVAQLRLRNIRAFEDTGIVSFRHEGALIVGENTAGKSTLLRSIALAALGPELANQIERRPLSYLRHGADFGTIEVAFSWQTDGGPEDEFVIGLAIRKGETGFRVMEGAQMTLALHNCATRLDLIRRRTDDRFGFMCAYGPFRTFSDPSSLFPVKDKVTLDRVSSLFDAHAPIIDPDLVAKLLSGEVASFRGAPQRLSLPLCKAMQAHLRRLLPDCEDLDHGGAGEVVVRGSPIGLRDLSDGYATVIALVGDMFRYSLPTSGWTSDPAMISGIALIDEIDAHLHPSWQRHVLPDLVSVFKNLQILTTTHSPMVAGSVDGTSVLHVFRQEDKRDSAVRRHEIVLQGLEADEILTGPLFGLEDTRDVGTEGDELRYDHLRQLPAPTEQENEERKALAVRLFGKRAEIVGRASKAVFAALEASLSEKLKSDSPGENARRLAEAEGLIEKRLAGR